MHIYAYISLQKKTKTDKDREQNIEQVAAEHT